MKNRTNTKKLLALGMATIFALTMAGCGTQDNSGATGSAADQTVGSQSAESSGNYTKIVYSYWTMDRIQMRMPEYPWKMQSMRLRERRLV